jgi:hypothetical protein
MVSKMIKYDMNGCKYALEARKANGKANADFRSCNAEKKNYKEIIYKEMKAQ